MISTYKFAEKQSINRGISKGESIFTITRPGSESVQLGKTLKRLGSC